MLSCLPLSSKPTATLEELYSAIRNINIAFADSPYTVDTLSFGTKTRLNGLKQLFDVPYLRPTPGVSPKVMFAENVVEENFPKEFALYQNYPNPFNPSTNFGFRIANFGLVTLKIYNMLGQEIAMLLNREEMEEGEYELPFNAINLPSGVFFYRINVESVDEDGMRQSFTDVKRMLLLK
ncbi:MAG: T9SS type A sorting domain-containing protein [Ignavibacteriales bacterium]|nr:T9SS type A sorting domain-containing protein [Ignavibacteriales bacterium]